MPLAIALLIKPLIPSDRMVDRCKQREQLIRTTILHRCAREHPDRSETGMPGQSQQCRRASSPKRLSEVSLIDDEKGSRWRQFLRQPGPAHQLQLKINPLGLPAPMRVKANRCHHHQPQINAAHERPGRKQRRKGLAKTHLISQNSATPGQ